MYYQLLKHAYSKSIKILSENSDRINSNFERADKIIIWLVGFSIGVFVLLLSSENNKSNTILKVVNELSPTIIVIALFVIILGLLFRLSSFFAQYYFNNALMNFVAYSDTQVTFPDLPEVREIKDSDTTDDILFYLELDYHYKQEKPEFLPEEKKPEYREVLKNFYESIAKTNNPEEQVKTFWYTYAQYFGLTKSEAERHIKGTTSHKLTGILQRIFFILTIFFFFSTIGTFISGVIIILVNIVKSFNCS